MAAKAYVQFDVPETVSFGGLTPKAISDDDEIIFLVEPSNRVGDAAVLDVEKIVESNPGKTIILFNPDLEAKGEVGIRERDRRQAFMDSFKPAYIYLCLVSQSVPPFLFVVMTTMTTTS